MKAAGRLELIDLATGIRPDPAGIRRSDRSGDRRVNISRANRVQDANGIRAHTHGEIMWQLTLDLGTGHIDRGNPQISLHPPNALL